MASLSRSPCTAKRKPSARDKARAQLGALLELFKSGDVPGAVAVATIPPFDCPSAKWSLANRILMLLAGTGDARGFRQWKEADRHVTKGARCFYILGPSVKKWKETDDAGDEVEKSALVGFHAIPVFRAEDTDGEPLDYPEVNPPEPPPLADVALAWGIDVSYTPFQGKYYGYYRPGMSEPGQQIVLCTHDQATFLHELAHGAHERVKLADGRKMQRGQDARQEIVAELSAAVLARLVGSQLPNEGRHYRYIESYAERMKRDVFRACMSVLADVEKVLGLILETASQADRKGVAA